MTTLNKQPDVSPALTRLASDNSSGYSRGIAALTKRLGDERITGQTALDYGAGFGRGVPVLARRFTTVEAYEPYDVDWQLPDTRLYTDPADVPTGRYDFIAVTYVLNILPPAERAVVIQHVYDCLAPSGIALFTVRPWATDVSRIKTGRPSDLEPQAFYVPRANTHTYQKGYGILELPKEIDWVLTGHTRDVAHPLPTVGSGLNAYVMKPQHGDDLTRDTP